MEKRNYVKPIILLNNITNSSFIAVSGGDIVYDEEDPIFAAVIEDCFRVAITIDGSRKEDGVTNDEIKGYFTTTGATTVCLQTDILSTCQASGLTNKTNYNVSYDAVKAVFIISNEGGCNNAVNNLSYSTK